MKLSLAPDLFNITLLVIANASAGLEQKRLLLDQCFSIVQLFKNESQSKEWNKIVDSQILSKLRDSVAEQYEKENSINILGILILDLNQEIEQISGRAKASSPKLKKICDSLDQASDLTNCLIN